VVGVGVEGKGEGEVGVREVREVLGVREGEGERGKGEGGRGKGEGGRGKGEGGGEWVKMDWGGEVGRAGG